MVWKIRCFKEVNLKVVELIVDLKSLRLDNLTEFGSLQAHTSGGECEVKGHYLKTRLVDHCLVNNKVMLGQETQYTYQSTKVWLR